MQSVTRQMVCSMQFLELVSHADIIIIVWASYLYYSSPRYLAAFLVNLAASILAIILATVTRVYLQRQNHKLERGLDMGRNGPTPAQIAVGFRYVV